MDTWVASAAPYVVDWLSHQMRASCVPGCVLSISRGSTLVCEQALGLADLDTGQAMTARHRFRVASLSKTVTAVGVLKLVEAGRLGLDHAAGLYVQGLHPTIASSSLRQLLSHTAGISRDGDNGGYFADMAPFPPRSRVMEELQKPAVVASGERFKYSNYGYALLGLVVEAVTEEGYNDWTEREVLRPLGLRETSVDVLPALAQKAPFARGHSGLLPLGHRVTIPADNPTDAFACVTGMVSTTTDMARFYARLSPDAADSPLSVSVRATMTTLIAPDVDDALGPSYGLGIHGGEILGWSWFGHVGRFQGVIVRSAVIRELDLALVLAVNAIDGPAIAWVDGIVHILRRFCAHGVPHGHAADWTGRWWNLWGPVDLVAMGERVFAYNPSTFPPFSQASEIELEGPDCGRVVRAPAMERFGEPVRRFRSRSGTVARIQIGSTGFASEAAICAQMKARYVDHSQRSNSVES